MPIFELVEEVFALALVLLKEIPGASYKVLEIDLYVWVLSQGEKQEYQRRERLYSTGEGHAEPSLGLNLLRNHHEREVSLWSFDI